MSIDEISAFDEEAHQKLEKKNSVNDSLKIDFDAVRLYFKLLNNSF